ncbi:MAG TPA: TlyA family RNA methyltransferase [Candidatus Limnocylindrales bacterium]|jgi:23S rRNA (cytidine1920-2'-O)/16S rRNA (cytidine1409-2'-O)-methyltransferase
MVTATAKRIRLDQLLVERGLVASRARAQALVLAGAVRVGDGDGARRDLKSGDLVARDVSLAVAEGRQWVSRGAYKLIAALDAFGVDPAGRVAADIGASTGGFTDVLLARGATRVYAVDVGYGQLAERLRHDTRVVSMERINARTLDAETLPEPVDLAVVDVSFISLVLVLAQVRSILRDGAGPILALVKPQFEAGKADAKGGVVRDPEVHRRVLHATVERAAMLRIGMRAVIASPIRGPEGNREFMVHLQAGPGCAEIDERIAEAVAAAWEGGAA